MDAKRGTLVERRQWAAARRESLRERDAARIELAEELAGRARLEIPAARGLLSVAPGGVSSEAGEVLAAANELIDSLGHERLANEYTRKKPAGMARGFLPQEAYRLDSPYLRFALGEEVVAPVAAYLGLVPVLAELDVWYSAHAPKAPHSSQMWHLDGDDTTQVK